MKRPRGLKPHYFSYTYAALKRRSSTLLHTFMLLHTAILFTAQARRPALSRILLFWTRAEAVYVEFGLSSDVDLAVYNRRNLELGCRTRLIARHVHVAVVELSVKIRCCVGVQDCIVNAGFIP